MRENNAWVLRSFHIRESARGEERRLLRLRYEALREENSSSPLAKTIRARKR